MIEGMLWIITIYGLGAAAVHVVHFRLMQRGFVMEPKHVTIVSKHSQLQIEWTIRSLLFAAWLKGEALRITVIDLGSTDDTLAILRKLSYPYYSDTIDIIK